MCTVDSLRKMPVWQRSIRGACTAGSARRFGGAKCLGSRRASFWQWRRPMKRAAVIVALWGCASKEAEQDPTLAPPDHALHVTETAGGVKVTGSNVPLATQPILDWFGLPMSGDVDVAIDVQKLDDPKQANGTIRISCPKGCRLGDDMTTLKPPKAARNSAFASELHFGHIDLDRFTIAIDIKDGKGTVSTFDVVSKDVVMKLAGTFEVAKPFSASRIDLCLRFASTPALEARDAKTHALLQTTGAMRASDGLFNIRLTDTFGNMKRLAVVCDGSGPGTPPVGDATPPSTEIDPDIAKLIASAVKSTSATTFEIDSATWDKLFANPAEVVKGARLVPAMRNGKPEGFKIYAIKPESLVARLGFQNGDTLVAILGEPMSSLDRGLEVYTKIRRLKPREPIDVIVMRKGTPITLTYKLK
jgi:hypothetical protein